MCEALDQTPATIHNEDIVIHTSLYILHFMYLSWIFNLVFNESPFNQKEKEKNKKNTCHQSFH